MYVPVTLTVSGTYTLGFEDLALEKSEGFNECFSGWSPFNVTHINSSCLCFPVWPLVSVSHTGASLLLGPAAHTGLLSS